MKLPRFTLRDLFWLVLVCALGLGWWASWRQLSRRRWDLERLVYSQPNVQVGIIDTLAQWMEEDGYSVESQDKRVIVHSPRGQETLVQAY